MALVAYDNSDSSEFEEDEYDDKTSITTAVSQSSTTRTEAPVPSTSEQIQRKGTVQEDVGQSLFTRLPQPSSKEPAVVEEDDDEFLHKKATPIVKPKARITVPLPTDFKDVEDSIPNKPKPVAVKKSGLLSMLPQPRNAVISTTTSKGLIPHILTQKQNNSTVKKKAPLPTQIKKGKVESKMNTLSLEYSDESDNEDEVQNDFFSINKPAIAPIEDMPLDIDINTKTNAALYSKQIKNVSVPNSQRQVPNLQSYFKVDPVELPGHTSECYDSNHNGGSSGYTAPEAESSSSSYIEFGVTSNNGDLALDDEAIRQLCGAKGKRKREDIQIVDVNQQEVLADAREWLMKGLMDDTSKRVSSSKRKGNEPTSQQRRKHQITYLAHQAKANEVELQNQWANNRMSKRQTQSKYGF